MNRILILLLLSFVTGCLCPRTQERTIIIDLSPAGQIVLDGRPVTEDELASTLTSSFHKNGGHDLLVIRASKESPSSQTRKVLNICTYAGLWQLLLLNSGDSLKSLDSKSLPANQQQFLLRDPPELDPDGAPLPPPSQPQLEIKLYEQYLIVRETKVSEADLGKQLDDFKIAREGRQITPSCHATSGVIIHCYGNAKHENLVWLLKLCAKKDLSPPGLIFY